VISSSQRPLSDNTQQSHQTDIYAPGGIRNQNPSKRAAADLRFRLRGHWTGRPFITATKWTVLNKTLPKQHPLHVAAEVDRFQAEQNAGFKVYNQAATD